MALIETDCISEAIDKMVDAEKRLLVDVGVHLLVCHGDKRDVFKIMPASKPGWYSDTYSAWIVGRWRKENRMIRASGAQMYFTGPELNEPHPQEWFDARVKEALERMEDFPDGGILPVNDPRCPTVGAHRRGN